MIRFRNVYFSFGETPVFEDLTLDIPKKCVLKAPSGRGKTTLLRLAAGLLRPDAGSVSGAPEKIAFLFQDDRLLPWLTAEENVAAVLPGERKDEAAAWLGYVELASLKNARPDELSGGQRRRVALARALAFGGDLLLLDEPFKGLDPALTDRMAGLVLSTGTDFLMASHSERETELMGGEIIDLP
ncbi:MAG: ABC transporter ATP-binding protein [Oscillospiraceae bacterium]|nr:ABC transporter ATP-binding protein [Oscillospiraceae bacterium]